MDKAKVDSYLLLNNKNFPHECILHLREELLTLDNQEWGHIEKVKLIDPTIALLFSIFGGTYGIDRFYLNDVTLGILKLMTTTIVLVFAVVYGFLGSTYWGILVLFMLTELVMLVWYFIDLFKIQKIARDKNFKKIQLILMNQYG